MKMMKFKKTLSMLLCTVLIAASVFVTGCTGQSETATTEATVTETTLAQETTAKAAKDSKTLSFTLKVVDQNGDETEFNLETDKKTVGEALMEEDLIQGEEGDYGLYVKTVNGITADYDKDQTYWAFYIDGEYASTGVDQTDVVEGAVYTLAVEK